MDVDIEIPRQRYSKPSFTVDLSEYGQIMKVLLSPYEYSQDIVLIAFSSKILVGSLTVEDSIDFKKLVEFEHPALCTGISLSPETCLNVLPACLLFCTAGNDFNLRVFKSDLKDENTCKILEGHSSYINDVSFDPETIYLASVSDDQSVKIWSTNDEYECVATLLLSSPGVSVCWHKEDTSKLMVAEKMGLIRFYNVDKQRPILSIDYNKPLSSVHWAPSDSQLLASLQMGELLLWDLPKPSQPTQVKLLYAESGGSIKFSPLGELIAAVNQLDSTLKVIHIPSMQQRLSAHVSLPTNLSWHFRFPLICIGNDIKLCFWKVSTK